METTLTYLADYADRLSRSGSPDQFLENVVNWQYREHYRLIPGMQFPVGRHAQREITRILLNQGIPLPEDGPLQPHWLQYDHLPTSAIGGFKGLIVIAANPYFTEVGNAQEMLLRNTEQANRDFCEFPFGQYAEYFNGVGWWSNVVAFAHSALDGGAMPNDAWGWAAGGSVGAIDLVPFHSSDDNITGRLEANPAGQGDAQQLRLALKSAAVEVVKMALRFKPRVMLAASRSGAVLTSQLGVALVQQGTAERMPDLHISFERNATASGGLIWHRQERQCLHSFRVHHSDGTSTLLLTLPGQLFSGAAGLQRLRGPLANGINDLL